MFCSAFSAGCMTLSSPPKMKRKIRPRTNLTGIETQKGPGKAPRSSEVKENRLKFEMLIYVDALVNICQCLLTLLALFLLRHMESWTMPRTCTMNMVTLRRLQGPNSSWWMSPAVGSRSWKNDHMRLPFFYRYHSPYPYQNSLKTNGWSHLLFCLFVSRGCANNWRIETNSIYQIGFQPPSDKNESAWLVSSLGSVEYI